MSEPTQLSSSLLELFGETSETVDFHGLAVPKLGVTIGESKMLTRLINDAIKQLPASADTLASALNMSEDELKALLSERKLILARDGEETRSAIYEARLTWVVFCLNRREVKVRGEAITAEIFEDMMPYSALSDFERLLTPGSTGAGDRGNASR